MGKLSNFFDGIFGNIKFLKHSAALRSHKRIKISYIGKLEQGEQQCSIVVMNYSEGGIKVRLEAFPKLDMGQVIYLTFQTREGPIKVAFSGVWQKNESLGLKVLSWDQWMQVLPMFSDHAELP